ncbi:uncharacterized protein LOC127833412 [Dreissena polymorpha]|uniref:Uncharacterized protein n=1 Tax=Dreissena polymorpha TaxID=45954 RepID=A0A9D4JGG8_DREPO|nr:uncharacterized protein LOC127833412 [Dreissena polymorpha]KAH3809149.1 hypothetical protein DPMN_137512 [Dreissena polymorpha]
MSGKEAIWIGPVSKQRESRFLPLFENNLATNNARSNINQTFNFTQVSQPNKQSVKNSSNQDEKTGLYAYIPPKHILQTLCPVDVRTTFPLHTANISHNISYVAKALTTTAVTPSGQRLRLALDENKYEIKHKIIANGADSDEEPDERRLHLLESETLNESPRESPRSPRPIRRLRRRSDHDDDDSDWEWPGDAEGSDSETCYSNNSTPRTVVKDTESSATSDHDDDDSDREWPGDAEGSDSETCYSNNSTPRTVVKDTESSGTNTQNQIQFSEVANQVVGTNEGHVEIPEKTDDVSVAVIGSAFNTAPNISSAAVSYSVNGEHTSEVANTSEVKDVGNSEIPDQTNGFSIVSIVSAHETSLTISSASGYNNLISDHASQADDVMGGTGFVKTVLQNNYEEFHWKTKSGTCDDSRELFKHLQLDECIERDNNTISDKFERNNFNISYSSSNTFSPKYGIANDIKPVDNSLHSQLQNDCPGCFPVSPSNNFFYSCNGCTCGFTCAVSGSQCTMPYAVNQFCCAPNVTSSPFMQSMVVGDDGRFYYVNIPVGACALAPPQLFSPWLECRNNTAFQNPICESCPLQNNCIQNVVQPPIPLIEPDDMSGDTILDHVVCTLDQNDVDKERPYFSDNRSLKDNSVLVDWSLCGPGECFQQQTTTFTECTENLSQEYVQTPYWNVDDDAPFTLGQDDYQIENRPLDNSNVTIDTNDGPPYPALHITEDGLMTVILREGIFLEMTPDRALRLVNHEKRLVIAMNEDGSRACVTHPCARISQSETTVNAELFRERKVKMMTEEIVFGNETNIYRIDYTCVTEFKPESSRSAPNSSPLPDEAVPVFRDFSQDESIHFMAQDYGKETVMRSQGIVERAYYQNQQTYGCKVIINGVKVVQTDSAEVTVYCGPIKFMRMHPAKSVVRLKTQFVEIDIEANWRVKVTRGSHALSVSNQGLVVSNGKIKASIDNRNRFQAFSVPEHRALMLGQPEREKGARKQLDSESRRNKEISGETD